MAVFKLGTSAFTKLIIPNANYFRLISEQRVHQEIFPGYITRIQIAIPVTFVETEQFGSSIVLVRPSAVE
jgi:hypothetical protein